MGFDKLQPADVDIIAVGAANGLDLAFLARCPEAFAVAVGRDTDTADQRVDLVAVSEGSVERFDDQRHVTFAVDKSVGVSVKRSGPGGADRLYFGKQD